MRILFEAFSLKSSHLMRLGMAAAMYLLLIWGHLSLSTPQWYAVFAALLMCIMLMFWVSEASEDCYEETAVTQSRQPGFPRHGDQTTDIPSLSASLIKLDTLKADLVEQYAQFGRDQTELNRKSLGCWHRNSDLPGRGK